MTSRYQKQVASTVAVVILAILIQPIGTSETGKPAFIIKSNLCKTTLPRDPQNGVVVLRGPYWEGGCSNEVSTVSTWGANRPTIVDKWLLRLVEMYFFFI